MNEDDDCRPTVRLMRQLLGIAGLALIAATWKLWTPQTLYPQVPFFSGAASIPRWCDWLALFLAIAGLVVAVAATGRQRWWRPGLIIFAISLVSLICIDQHRFQPWAYQFAIVALVLAVMPANRTIMLLKLLTISIYIHSAISKIDYSFIHTNGQQLVAGLMQNFGTSIDIWPESVRITFAAALPIGEFLVAVFLCIPRSRRSGLYGSIVMHLLLLAATGPWGLNHKPAVLLWNVYFIFQNWFLFKLVPAQQKNRLPDNRLARLKPTKLFVQSIVIAVVLLPLLEPFGLFDHWPAWGLYASRPERIQVDIHESRRDDLPDELLQHVDQPQFETPWCRLRIDRWSLAELSSPIYPQSRFQLGVALAIGQQHQLGKQIRVVMEIPANRWTGNRESREVTGISAIEREVNRFRLNARPRKEEK